MRTALAATLSSRRTPSACQSCSAAVSRSPQGPQPLSFALVAGLLDEFADQEVKEVEGVIHGDDLEGSRKGQQGGNAAFRDHAGDGLRSRGGAMAGQGAQAAGRDVIQRKVRDTKGPYGLETLQGLNQSGPTHPYGRPPELIQGA